MTTPRWIHGRGLDGDGEYLVHTALPRTVFEVIRTTDVRGEAHIDVRLVQRTDMTHHDAASLLIEARGLLSSDASLR